MHLDWTIKALYWCAVFCTFFLSYFSIGFYPPSNYFALLIIYVLIIKIFISRENIFRNHELIVYTLLISLIISLTMVIAGDSIFEIIIRILKSVGVGLILSMASFNVVCTYGLRSAIKPILLFGTITSIVAIMQAIGFDFAWSLREVMGYADDFAIEDQITKRLRVPGMAFYSITLSYQLLVVLALLAIAIQYRINDLAKVSSIYIIIGVIVITAMMFTGARSAYPVTLLMVFIIFSVGKGFYKYVFLFCLIGLLFSTVYFNEDLLLRLTEIGLGGRLNTFYNSTLLLLHEPFGIGNNTGDFKRIILSKSYNTSGSFQFAHNHLLTAGVKFGIVPILIYISYNIILFFRVYLNLGKNASIVTLAIIVYQLNTMFHNGGMLIGEQNGWYMFGIIEALIFTEKRRVFNESENK